MSTHPRVPIFEIGAGGRGKINVYERRADWLYDRSKPVVPGKSKVLLIASVEAIGNPNPKDITRPNDISATLQRAAEAISGKHRYSNTRRWGNYRLAERFVFIAEDETQLYRPLGTVDPYPFQASTEEYIHLILPVQDPKLKHGTKQGHYHIVKNPNRGKNISELLS